MAFVRSALLFAPLRGRLSAALPGSLRAYSAEVASRPTSLAESMNIQPPYGPEHLVEPGPRSQRFGLVARKLGMTHTYTEWGERVVLTALQVGCVCLSV